MQFYHKVIISYVLFRSKKIFALDFKIDSDISISKNPPTKNNCSKISTL